MKKEIISIQFKLPGGGVGLKQVEVELPDGAYDIGARPQASIISIYVGGNGGGTKAGAGGFSVNADMGGTPK